MGVIESLCKTCLYFIMVFGFYICVKKKYNNGVRLRINEYRTRQIDFGMVQSILCSLVFGVYSVFITATELTHDRFNYAYSYSVGRKLTPAMNFLFDILRNITSDPKIIFFFISFLMLFLLFIACEINKDFLPKAFLFLVTSNLLIFSYYGLKQAPAIGFIAIAVSLWLTKKYILAIGCAIIAVLFHESALIFFPMIILLTGAKSRWIRIMEYAGMLLFLVAFPQMTQMALRVLMSIGIPVMGELEGYLDSIGGMAVNINVLTVFKGVPYYLITILGICFRKKIKAEIENYDKYLVMSIFTSVVYMASLYMYWMWRFAIYFYFFDFIFAAQLIDKCENKKRASLFYYIVLFLLVFINFRYYMQYFINYGGF